MKDVRPEILAFAKSPKEKTQLEILIRELQKTTLEYIPNNGEEYYIYGRIAKLDEQIQELQK